MLTAIAELILRLFARLPRRISQTLGAFVGRLNLVFRTRSHAVTRVNLSLCFPSLDSHHLESLVKESLVNTGKTALETPAVWLAEPERLESWIEDIECESLLTEEIEAQRGVIVLLPHVGNWELFNYYTARFGGTTALYQPPRKKYLQPVMQTIRERGGSELVEPSIKGLARLYRALGEGRIVTILPDQVPATGIYVPFFGVEALSDVLISRLVNKTGAKVLTCCVIRQADGRFRILFRPVDSAVYAVDIDESVRGVNSTVENCVLEYPAQYQWEYKRFRERPKGERKLYRFDRVEYH